MLSNSDSELLIGTYTEPRENHSEGIHVYRMDGSSGELIYQDVIEDAPNASFMAVHPQLGLVYAVNETEEFDGSPGGGVSVLARDAAGRFKVIDKQSSGGVHPCYISVERSGRFALVANYTSGTVSMLPIEVDGRLRPASDVVQHVGSSVHPERQTSPHAHCILPDPSNHFAVAVDLGLDKLIVYRMDLDAGKLYQHSEVQVDTGAGPRHLIFHPQGPFAYLLNELNSTVAVYRYDFENSSVDRLQSITTLPKDFSGENFCSDLRFSSDGKHLYISNRGHDNIVCFKVHAANGEITYQSQEPANGHYPRILALDPSGRFMVAVHQKSNNAVVLKIDPETGDLSQTGHEARLDMPVHVLFP